VIHLDEYRYLPGTQSVERPDTDLERMHDEATNTDQWVVEGLYSCRMPGRLRRATSLLHLDASTAASIGRYFRRGLFEPDRAGSLDGTRDRIRVEMVRFLLGPSRRSRLRYRDAFEEFDRPKLLLPDRATLEEYYRLINLARQSP
jgi:hypothetical protein